MLYGAFFDEREFSSNPDRNDRLVNVSNPASQQSELGVLEFRQIKCKGDLSLKPGLHRVPIGGDYIYRR